MKDILYDRSYSLRWEKMLGDMTKKNLQLLVIDYLHTASPLQLI